MNTIKQAGLSANEVYCSRVPKKSYTAVLDAKLPELPGWVRATSAIIALRSLMAAAGFDNDRVESAEWNPLEELVADKKIVLKPNWVLHENGSGHSLDCLITNSSVLEAILHYVVKARPRTIVIGDAPIQRCDFKSLLLNSGMSQKLEQLSRYGIAMRVKDFRRTIRSDGRLETKPTEDCIPMDDFILYDIGGDSALEEITRPGSEFRVTMYNPDMLKQTHSPRKHQYLIARDVIDADVVFNVPKLKTHKKACITGSLKNLVGINGHKEYLPHHRKGNPKTGGDCYPEQSLVKGVIEDLQDAANRSNGSVSRWLFSNAARAGTGFRRLINSDDNFEGSWHGNDTVWRMTLDLQRILRYGRADASLSNTSQRTVISITDAIICGEGDGPLAPIPVELGMMTFGLNTAAVEWINALLMGLPPDRIALTREAFAESHYPLADFAPQDISVIADGIAVNLDEIFPRYGRRFMLPSGWQEMFWRDSSA